MPSLLVWDLVSVSIFKSLSDTVAIHGEQFLLTRVSQAGEKVVEMAVNEVPCGHCRQFLKEVRGSEDIKIYIREFYYDGVSALLPNGFGPAYVYLSITITQQRFVKRHTH